MKSLFELGAKQTIQARTFKESGVGLYWNILNKRVFKGCSGISEKNKKTQKTFFN